MSRENETLSYNELIEELKQLCDSKSTGTMFIVSDKGHSSRISIKDGEILFFAYRMNKGFDGLFDLYDMKFGKYHFSKGVFNPYNILELPDTTELLEHFRLKSFPQGSDLGEGVTSSNSTLIHSKLDGVSRSAEKGQKSELASDKVALLIEAIESSLINYLGPFADISIQDYLADNPRPTSQAEFRTMIDFLTLEIDDISDQATFKNETIKIISQ